MVSKDCSTHDAPEKIHVKKQRVTKDFGFSENSNLLKRLGIYVLNPGKDWKVLQLVYS